MTNHAVRIAILGLHYAPEQTGNAPYTSALAEGLQRLGYDVRVITAHPHYPEWRIREGYGEWAFTEMLNDVPVTRLLHYVPRKPSNIRRLISEVSFGARLLTARWGDPDVVLLVSPALFSTSAAVLRARLGLRRPAIAVWVQDLYSLGMAETGSGGTRTTQLMKQIEARTLRAANGVSAIHERFKAHMTRELGVRDSAVEVIRNWTHLGDSPTFDKVVVRRQFGWGDHETVVLHAGNMGVKQGLENVVHAARLADMNELPIRFVLMGNGNQRDSLESFAKGIRCIQFMPSVASDEFQAAMGSADVLLVNELPGVAEMSVPSKLTSYFSTGLPVLGATDEGSVTAGELERSGAGVRVDAGSPADLLGAISQLAADPGLRSVLGASGLRYRDTMLSEGVALAKYAEWLERLAATASGSRASRKARRMRGVY